jgi:hypothetical protein
MNRVEFLSICLLASMAIGCGPIPTIRENHKGLAPWEKLPAGNGITYLEQFTDDPGREPVYLAKIKYDDDAALQTVIKTFGLVPNSSLQAPSSWVGKRKLAPAWFPLNKVTQLYFYVDEDNKQHVANLWVNEDEQVVILERSWW